MTHLIIFDTEFTTWEGAQARFWSGENEFREIVQLAALKTHWPTGEIVDSINLIARPVRNPVVSDFFTQLTGVTQERIQREGLSFADVLERFKNFCGDDLTGSYGNDPLVLAETAQLQNVIAPYLGGMAFVNLAYYIHRFDETSRGVNSGQLWKHFGLPKPNGADEHDALFDCHSIAVTLDHLRANDALLPLESA